jgi:hypothetical protein
LLNGKYEPDENKKEIHHYRQHSAAAYLVQAVFTLYRAPVRQ